MKTKPFLIFLFIFSYVTLAQDLNPTNEIDHFIQSEMENEKFPGLSTLVIKNQQVIWQKSYGFANLDNDIETTDSTIFLLASVSKLFTGTAIMQLYEHGDIKLDEDINHYLPFVVEIPGYEDDSITFRMLLTHTSSICDGDAMDNYYSDGDPDISLADCMQRYFSVDGIDYDVDDNFYDHPPGTVYEYSNMASALLGYLVEVIADMPFDQYCQDNIFNPLDMSNTAWHLADLNINYVATPYGYRNKRYFPYDHYGFADYPNGLLRSNIIDLTHFIFAYINNGVYEEFSLLNQETIEEMWTLQFTNIVYDQGLS